MSGWINGVRCDVLAPQRERDRAGRASVTRQGLTGRAIRRALGGRSLGVKVWCEGTGHEERGNALLNLLDLGDPIILHDEDGNVWEGKGGLLCKVNGSPDRQIHADLTKLRFTVTIVAPTKGTRLEARVRSIIQDNDFSDAGETRVLLPGQATQLAGGGTLETDGKWVTDPLGFQGKSYAANEPLNNYSDLMKGAVAANDWHRAQPFVVPTSHLDQFTPLVSDSGASPVGGDVSASDSPLLIAEAEYDWDGTTKDPTLRTQDRWDPGSPITHKNTLVVPGTAAGTFQYAWAAWERSEGWHEVNVAHSDASLSNVSIDVYELDKAWHLDDGDELSNFVAGIGAGQVYVHAGEWICLHNARLDAATYDAVNVRLAGNSPSWWTLRNVTENYVHLRSDQGDDLWIWANGLVEWSSDNTIEIHVADQGHSQGTTYYTPDSTRDVTLTSLKEYSATVSSSVATLSQTDTGQRFGAGFEQPGHFFRRTRATWTPEVG